MQQCPVKRYWLSPGPRAVPAGRPASPHWRLPATCTTLRDMDTVPLPADSTQAAHPETEAERQSRLAWEAEGIAEARADVAAGRLVDAAKVRAWVDSLRTDNPLPVPYSGR
jgi:predicted transcriptional regulator